MSDNLKKTRTNYEEREHEREMSDNPPTTGQAQNIEQERTSEPGTNPVGGGTNNVQGTTHESQSFDFGMNPPPNSGATAIPPPQNPTAPPTQNNVPEMESLLGTPKEPTSVSQPTSQPQMGPGVPPTASGPNIGSMPNPIPGMPPQIPQNPKTSQGPTKSHLAEILGAHEMNQLQTMARPLDHQNPAAMPNPTGQGGGNPPTQPNRPNNPGQSSFNDHIREFKSDLEMMGMRPNHGMPNMGGGFNPNMAGYQHMFPGMPPSGPGMPPGHFRNCFYFELSFMLPPNG